MASKLKEVDVVIVGLGWIIAYRNGVARGVLHQIVAHDVAQLVADIGQ